VNLHETVLLEEACAGLNIQPDGIYVDGTFGRGGHSQRILQDLGENGQLLGVDHDPEAVSVGQALHNSDARFQMYHGSFADLNPVLKAQQIDGLLLDLGVSSPQLDNAERGFSFMRDGPLDMRMNPNIGQSAADWINVAKAEEIADVLYQYGEERHSRRLAGSIVYARETTPLTSTTQLANIIRAAHPAWEKKKHPATRSFQAIRIFINGELDALDAALANSLNLLKKGGRLAIISFHSLEDRRVKRFIRDQFKGKPVPRGVPIMEEDIERNFKPIGKAIKASRAEIAANPRSRSAVLRIAERL
jgi:16S rRNA (cytosine1402-N4)-methyltransferase